MKKFLAAVLSLALVLSMSSMAWADVTILDEEGYPIDVTPGEDYEVPEGKVVGYIHVDENDSQKVIGDVVAEVKPVAVYIYEGTVYIDGNVTTDFISSYAVVSDSNSLVGISGDLTVKNEGEAIYAFDSTVVVGGDVFLNNESGEIYAYDSTIVVEGALEGGAITIYDNPASPTSIVCIGEIKNDNPFKPETVEVSQARTYYLIGTDESSDIQWGDGVEAKGSARLQQLDVDTASGKEYDITQSVTGLIQLQQNEIVPEITISAGSSKIEVVNSIPGVVGKSNPDGSYTLQIPEIRNFHGGLANLIIRLMKENPALAAALMDNTIYYDAANYDMETGNITVTGADADAVTAYNQADHAGVSFAASCLKADGANDIRVFNGEEELSSKDFSCHFHQDGSVSIIISNTYLLTRGAGAYNFKAFVNGVEADFDLVVLC